jgi:hypothetical protein
MKLILLALLVCVSGCSAKNSEEELRVKTISAFAGALVDTLKTGNADAYQRMWVRSSDEWADVNGRPLLISIPVKEEAFQRSDEIDARFKIEREKLLAYLGQDLSKLQVLHSEYIIKDDPVAKQSRLFEFELRVQLENGIHSCILVQRSCAMTKRGVVIGDYLSILTEENKHRNQ